MLGRKTLETKNNGDGVASLDENEDTSSAKHPKITILDAILRIYDAWNKSTTIFNCYKHAGFIVDDPGVTDSISVAADNNNDDDDDVGKSSEGRTAHKNEKLEPIDENILQNVVINSQDSDDNDVDDGPEENCPTASVS
ncbi:hypothetical protein HHI36_022556 [Cryptolaemus montrouzieri]|uniref:Uncharacterized protein n=1 Tax=Cryptolaemus montrouzieri TaxID=559131 RepID=A0ABD2N0C7_9CUCU